MSIEESLVQVVEITFNYTLRDAKIINEFIEAKDCVTLSNNIMVRNKRCNCDLGIEAYGRNRIDIKDITKSVGRTTENTTFWQEYKGGLCNGNPTNEYRRKVIEALNEVLKLAKEWKLAKNTEFVEDMIKDTYDEYFQVVDIYDKEESTAIFTIDIKNDVFMNNIRGKSITADSIEYFIVDASGVTSSITVDSQDAVDKIKKELTNQLGELLHNMLKSIIQY